MESLYRKYRPLTFGSVVGQRHIVSTLEHAVTEGRLGHAYLFCGPRGTGKTTMARILAKALLCEHAEAARTEGASGCLPDGTCPECAQVAEGVHPDVYELDAASRTGVDNVREEIIGSVNFAPVRGAFKIYIIDEVHMLTTAAFNALLKTLEEPPSHVVFVLCTTDPQKIPETILSRCQRFDFHRIGNEDIVARLRHICEQEQFGYDDEALDIVARHARGGMRDALSTLEQLSVFGNGAVHVVDARSLLGEVSGTVLSELCRAIAARDVPALFGLVRAQVDAGEDLIDLTRDLVAHVRDVYVARVAGAQTELFEGTPEEVGALTEEAELFEGTDRLARVLTVLDDAALEMRTAADTRLVLEIALTRLARPESDLTLEALAERVARLESQLAAGVPSAPLSSAGAAVLMGVAAGSAPGAATDGAASEPPALGAKAGVAAAASEPASSVEHAPEAPAAPSAANADLRPTPPSAAEVAAAAAAPTAPVSDEGELQRKWRDVIKRVIAAQPSRGALLQSSRAGSDDGTTLTVRFPAGSNFAISMLGRADTQSVVLPQIAAVFGARTVRYVTDDAPAHAPAAPRRASPAPAASAAPANATGSVAPARADAPASAPSATVSVSVPSSSALGSPDAAQPDSTSTTPAPARADIASAAAQADRAAAPSVPAQANSAAATPAPARPEPAAAVPAPVQSGAPVRPEPAFAAPASSQPNPVSAPSAPTDEAAWEDDRVPYDDLEAMPYDESLPPFDMPEDVSPTPPPAPSVPASPPETAQPDFAARPPQSFERQAGADGQLNQQIDPDDVASVLGSVFGEEVKLTQVDTPL